MCFSPLFFTPHNKFLAPILLTLPEKNSASRHWTEHKHKHSNTKLWERLKLDWIWNPHHSLNHHGKTGRKNMKRSGQHHRVRFTNCCHPYKRNLKIVVSISSHNNHVHSNFMRRNPSFCKFYGLIYLPWVKRRLTSLSFPFAQG